jgi:TetR/AcrR family transcriptional regulator, transcriptional repressor for nem operon
MNDTKTHILKTAIKLFLQKTFKEVTMKEIVDATGLSKGAFYHYFTSKEQVFLETVEDYITNTMTLDWSRYSKLSLYEFFNDYLENATEKLKEFRTDFGHTYNINFYSLFFDAFKLFPEFREKIYSAQNAERNAWRDIVSLARKNGEIKSPMTDEQIAQIFIYVSDGVGISFIQEGKSEETMMTEIRSLWENFYKQLCN